VASIWLEIWGAVGPGFKTGGHGY